MVLPVSMSVFHQQHDQAPLQPYLETMDKIRDRANGPNWGLADQNLPVLKIVGGQPQIPEPPPAPPAEEAVPAQNEVPAPETLGS